LNLEFACATVVDELEFSDVTVQLHYPKHATQEFGGWANHALALVAHLVVNDGYQTIGQRVHLSSSLFIFLESEFRGCLPKTVPA
jgi:hypothetical protein